MGLGGGKNGGNIVAQGIPKIIIKSDSSITGKIKATGIGWRCILVCGKMD